MQIQPGAMTHSVAGTARAAAKGGEADSQASEAISRQAIGEKPAGKTAEASEVEAGEQTGDRGGDGRQMYDQFEPHEEHDESEQTAELENDEARANLSGNDDSHIDFEA